MIVGFNFKKISAERKKNPENNISINNNVQIKGMEKEELKFKKGKEAGLKIMFEFKSAYEPGLGEVVFEGELIDVEEEKIAEDALKQWKKDKTISQVLARPIIDSILARSTIESVIVSREIGLPPPIPVPRVSEKTTQQYIG